MKTKYIEAFKDDLLKKVKVKTTWGSNQLTEIIINCYFKQLENAINNNKRYFRRLTEISGEGTGIRYYCDICGKEISEENKNPFDKLDLISAIGDICKKCVQEDN